VSAGVRRPRADTRARGLCAAAARDFLSAQPLARGRARRAAAGTARAL